MKKGSVQLNLIAQNPLIYFKFGKGSVQKTYCFYCTERFCALNTSHIICVLVTFLFSDPGNYDLEDLFEDDDIDFDIDFDAHEAAGA